MLSRINIAVMLALVSALAFSANAYNNLKLVERVVEYALQSTEEAAYDASWTGVGYPVVSRNIPSKELTRAGYKTSYNNKTLNPEVARRLKSVTRFNDWNRF